MRSLHLGILLAITVAYTFGMTLEECKERAAAGDAEALWQLGQRYENGEGVRKDGLKAISQYRKAADKNHIRACERLAFFYETGKIVAKDPVKAARYRAQSKGESAEMAAALAQTAQDRSKVDYIEVALDYIIGRNGQSRDAKKGIQLLYKVAKDNPTAQRVFVERWEKGDLDEGLNTLDSEEWNLVIPWFRTQYEKGRHKGGMILGNEAYRNKRYDVAERYWRAAAEAGLPKAWFLLGKFYCFDEGQGGGPKSVRSDIKAKKAFERCLKLDSSWSDARINIGFLCVFGDEKCIDYPRAMSIFSAAMKTDPNDQRYPYWYGCAGRNQIWSKLNSRWKDDRVKYLWAQNEKKALTNSEYLELKRFVDELKQCEADEEKYMRYILQSANKGYEPAKECYREWAKKHGRNADVIQDATESRGQHSEKDVLISLREKWPHAADRVSNWEMPRFAKRFHEIDYYQHNKWDKNSAESNAEFERMIREAIAMKIEPAIWYYNLACILSLQNKKRGSLDALEQAIVAGYDKPNDARKDSDFANVRRDPRFGHLLALMSIDEHSPYNAPREVAIPRNGSLLLTDANSYFVFNHYAYYSVIGGNGGSMPIYIDMEGVGSTPRGYCRAEYEQAAKQHGVNAGLAKHYFRKGRCCLPTVVRGKFDPSSVKTSAFNAEKIASRNVLGLYSARKRSDVLNWCILYEGLPEDGVRLAEIIGDACANMPARAYEKMIDSGEYATTMVKLVHKAMKPGKDGSVIKVGDVDRCKLNQLVEEL